MNIYMDPVQAAKSKVMQFLKGIGYGDPLMTFTSLRLHANLRNSVTNYEMRFQEAASSNGDDERERKLAPDHWFFPMYLAIWLERYSEEGKNGSMPSFPYVDENYFNYDDGNGLTEAESLRLVYSGHTTFELHSKKAIRELDNMDYQTVPDHQYLPAAVAGQASPEYPIFGPSDAARGFRPLYALDMIKGDDGSKILFELGKGNNTAIEGNPNSNLKNRAVFNVKGWWVTGKIGSEETKDCRLK